MPAQASPIPISDVLLAYGLGCLTDSPGLPQVTPLVCGDDVQPGGEAEADSANEWVREPHARGDRCRRRCAETLAPVPARPGTP